MKYHLSGPKDRSVYACLWTVFFTFCFVLVTLTPQSAFAQERGQDVPIDKPAVVIFAGDPENKADQRREPEIGDSVSIALRGMPPSEAVEILLEDEDGNEWSGARVNVDKRGNVAPFLLWYHSGVIGRRPSGLKMEFEPKVAFKRFEEAEKYFSEKALIISVRDLKKRVLFQDKFKLAKPERPVVFASDKEGTLMNSMHVKEDRMFVSGKRFRSGQKVSIAVVRNQHRWVVGDEIVDITGKDGAADPDVVQVPRGRSDFVAPVWEDVERSPGAFDIIVRVGDDFKDNRLRRDDIISYGDDTAVVLFAIINGNVVIDISGRDIPHPGKFEFNDSFEKGEDVWGAVDTTDVPTGHLGGAYAAYYVVNDEQPSYWDGVSPAIIDVSGGHEIHRVKYWCLNGTRRMIWGGATQAAPIGEYDVVVDFGATPAATLADYVPDNVYDKGYDFIDGYDTVGFYVFEDPGSMGPFTVATVDHDDPSGITGMPFDAAGITGPNYVIDRAWGRIMYPSDGSVGASPPVDPSLSNYPVALFLHGRHHTCNLAGGTSSSYNITTCPAADHIPSHQGYDYIMERLASQGIISVSIDAFEIQPDGGQWNYDVRGRLVLKWLDILRDWNDNGTDPFGGIFQSKLDMTKIALSGHSRGGEGVVAAEVLNATWPTPHNIVAVNAIAPTDQNSLGGVSYVSEVAPYYLIIGARDGDVSNMQGVRTYDRAYPQGAANRQHKTMSIMYGANHNFYNTIWTPTADLGSPNPWNAFNDGWGVDPMSAADQRQAGLSTIAGFFRRHLQGFEPYKEIMTGRYEPSLMPNERIFWTYQDANRVAVDNFEDMPSDVGVNTLGGTNSFSGFTTAEETHLNSDSSDYSLPVGFPSDSYNHDTIGVKLIWASPGTYEIELPGATGFDASGFTHLNLRGGKRASTPTDEINLHINVEDASGTRNSYDMLSEQWDPIPAQYRAGNAMMTGVRIPLRAFTQFDSGVDLTQLKKIIIEPQGNGEMAIDDVEFTD